jgi:hypothetical protein
VRVVEYRDSIRKNINLFVELRMRRSVLHGLTRNLSANGAYVETDGTPPPEYSVVALWLEDAIRRDGGASYAFKAMVAHSTRYGMGLHILQGSDDAWKFLRERYRGAATASAAPRYADWTEYRTLEYRPSRARLTTATPPALPTEEALADWRALQSIISGRSQRPR